MLRSSPIDLVSSVHELRSGGGTILAMTATSRRSSDLYQNRSFMALSSVSYSRNGLAPLLDSNLSAMLSGKASYGPSGSIGLKEPISPPSISLGYD